MSTRLSKASEKKILDALEKAANLISDGMHPNDALIKIAADDQIPAGHIRLMVNAINTGRVNAHRLSTDDPLEKAADIPLVDADLVLGKLYPDEVKTKQAEFLETAISKEYERPPLWIGEQTQLEKAAAKIDWKMTDKTLVVEREDNRVKKALADQQRYKHSIDEKSREVTLIRHAAIKLAASLRDYFKSSGHIPFNEVFENAVLLFGKQAETVLNNVKPEKEVAPRYGTSTPVNINAAPYSLIAETCKLASAFKTSSEEQTQLIKTASEDVESQLRPFVPGPAMGRSVMAGLFSQKTKTASIFGSVIGGGLGMMRMGDVTKEIARRSSILPVPAAAQEQSDLQGLMDPMHESEIRNIQSEALLNDLMANDEVVKGFDPEEVIDAFNEISQVLPYAANKKAIMRDLMRKRLSGGGQALDQFVLGDALKSQQSMRENEMPSDKRLSVLQAIGAIDAPKV